MLLSQMDEIFEVRQGGIEALQLDIIGGALVFLLYCAFMSLPLLLNLFMSSSFSKEKLLKRYFVRIVLVLIPFIGFWISLMLLIQDIRTLSWKGWGLGENIRRMISILTKERAK